MEGMRRRMSIAQRSSECLKNYWFFYSWNFRLGWLKKKNKITLSSVIMIITYLRYNVLEFWQYLVTSHHKHQTCRLYNGIILKWVVRPKSFIFFSFTKNTSVPHLWNFSMWREVCQYIFKRFLPSRYIEKTSKTCLFEVKVTF